MIAAVGNSARPQAIRIRPRNRSVCRWGTPRLLRYRPVTTHDSSVLRTSDQVQGSPWWQVGPILPANHLCFPGATYPAGNCIDAVGCRGVDNGQGPAANAITRRPLGVTRPSIGSASGRPGPGPAHGWPPCAGHTSGTRPGTVWIARWPCRWCCCRVCAIAR